MTVAGGINWTAIGGVATLIGLICTGIATWIGSRSWAAAQADRVTNVKKVAYDEGYCRARNLYEPQLAEAQRKAALFEQRWMDLITPPRGGVRLTREDDQ